MQTFPIYCEVLKVPFFRTGECENFKYHFTMSQITIFLHYLEKDKAYLF